MAAHAGELEVEGHRLRIENLDRVLYPSAGTTKAEVLDYYVRIAPAMLPHLAERYLHMHRYPEGVDGVRFWEKQCPPHRPPFVRTSPVYSREKAADIDYCVIDGLPALLWAVNIGSLEVHTSLSRAGAYERPTAVAFDLDPGDGAGMAECCEVALLVRTMLDGVGLRSFAKTSGGKGLQVYVPLNEPDLGYPETKRFARTVAEVLEASRPELVVARVAKSLRAGRVLVDWGQNTEHKSMVCAYSLRARQRPTVSTPVTWEEVAADPEALRFEGPDVLERVAAHGDLFADVLTMRQKLPAL